MTDDTQVHPTSQEGESTQPDVKLDPSTSEGENENLTPEQQAAKDQESKETKDPNGWAVKRIGDLTRQRHEAERKAEQAVQEAAQYRAILEQMQKGDDQAPTPKGQPEDIDALVERRAAEKAQQQAIAARGQSVAKAGADAFEDFPQAIQTLDALGITPEQVSNLLGMDDAHQVIYQLGKNPEEAARILALPPIQQGRELERIAAKAAQAPAPKPVSKAPQPITPVDSVAAAEKAPSKMTTAEWMEWRNKTAKTRF